MSRYTEKIHAKRMVKILESKDPCNKCPSYKNPLINHMDQLERSWIFNLDPELSGVCKMCKEFIGLSGIKYKQDCPCYEIGEAEAIKQTWISLEERGYI